MRYLFIILMLFVGVILHAQETTGSVVGVITDKEMNNDPLPFANVQIKGSEKGTTTDMDGLYEIGGVAPGIYTVLISFVGYETLEVPNISVEGGKVTELNTALGASSVNLDEVVVTTTSRRDSETALLLDQKKAIEIKQSIGAQELARKGVSDVAAAVTKTTGVSKQEGSGSIYVRGLGDRYNATTMNGLPLPSNNPSRKNINLDLYSTDIVEYIGISKTFEYKNYGDFAGANIDIVSKNYKGDGFLQLGMKLGGNTNAMKQDKFYLQDGPSKTGFYDPSYPKNPLSAYNFNTSWDRQTSLPVNNSLSLTGGKSFDVGVDGRMSFFGAAFFDNGFKYKEGVARGSVSTQGIPRKDFTFDSYEYETNTTLLGNVFYKVNTENTLNFNTLYINSTNQEHEEYNGIIDVFDNAPNGGGFVRRSTFDRTALFVNQLLGKHKLNEKLDFDWGVSYNMVKNSIPDRMQNTFVPIDNNNFQAGLQASDLATSDNHRYYQHLKENELSANIGASYSFNKDDEGIYKGKVSLGYSGRFKNVAFDAVQFNFRINRDIVQPQVSPTRLDDYFNQASVDARYFQIITFRGGLGTPGVLDPQIYNGEQVIHAAYGALEYKFSPKFTGVFGLRGEHIYQNIEWETSLDTDGGKNDFKRFEIMPTASLKYGLTENQNLRFAASKTYTLPQFKERAPFQYEEVTQVYFGNPDLYPSTDYNVDLKWELFPSDDQLVSVTGFGKYIQNPINEITVASATNDLSYVNTGKKAVVVGGELEIRKNIINFSGEDELLKNTISTGFNASYMYTNQDFDREKVDDETNLSVGFTNQEGRLTGASDFLVNADLSYIKEFTEDKNIMATVSYNYFSDRLYAIGTNNRGNLVDKAVGTLDFILNTQLNEKIGLGFKVRNLLNPTVERFQETQNVMVESYKKGMNFNLSLNYKF